MKLPKPVILLLCAAIALAFSGCALSDVSDQDAQQTASLAEAMESVEIIPAYVVEDVLRDVLLGESSYTDMDSHQVADVSGPTTMGGHEFDTPLSPQSFTLVDVDGDNIVEAIVTYSDGKDTYELLLHCVGSHVYGYGCDFEEMAAVFTDGTMEYIDSSHKYQYYSISFDGSEILLESTEPGTSLSAVQWYSFTDDNIDATFDYILDGSTALDINSVYAVDPHRADYENACALMQSGSYSSALELLETMPDYEDSARLMASIRCADYADTVANKVSAHYLATVPEGVTMTFDYSVHDYTFTTVFNMPEEDPESSDDPTAEPSDEDVEPAPDTDVNRAKDIYYEYFYSKGYADVTCVVITNYPSGDLHLREEFSGSDAKAVSGGSSGSSGEPAATAAPSVIGGITVSAELYSVTLPSDWEGRYVCEKWDAEDFRCYISLCEKQSYDDGSGGVIFELALAPDGTDYSYLPSYQLLGTLTASGQSYTVIAIYPTDVEYSADAMSDYTDMTGDITAILSSFRAASGVYTPA